MNGRLTGTYFEYLQLATMIQPSIISHREVFHQRLKHAETYRSCSSLHPYELRTIVELCWDVEQTRFSHKLKKHEKRGHARVRGHQKLRFCKLLKESKKVNSLYLLVCTAENFGWLLPQPSTQSGPLDELAKELETAIVASRHRLGVVGVALGSHQSISGNWREKFCSDRHSLKVLKTKTKASPSCAAEAEKPALQSKGTKVELGCFVKGAAGY